MGGPSPDYPLSANGIVVTILQQLRGQLGLITMLQLCSLLDPDYIPFSLFAKAMQWVQKSSEQKYILI